MAKARGTLIPAVKSKTLAEAWELWRRTVLDPRTSKENLDVLRSAFYSGAVSCANLIQKANEGKDDDARASRLNVITNELNAFVTQVHRDSES